MSGRSVPRRIVFPRPALWSQWSHMTKTLRRWSVSVGLPCALLLVWTVDLAAAHGVAQDDASFFLTNVGAAIGPFMYLGAKHMFTGYDHILFLVGVIFFLYRLQDVVLYVSLFTLGHSLTLLAGVLWGVQANPTELPWVHLDPTGRSRKFQGAIAL